MEAGAEVVLVVVDTGTVRVVTGLVAPAPWLFKNVARS